jgi:hypothetical protein
MKEAMSFVEVRNGCYVVIETVERRETRREENDSMRMDYHKVCMPY